MKKWGAEGHEIQNASGELVAKVDAITSKIVAQWIVDSAADGVANPQAVLPDVKIQKIFKGLIPFITADALRLVILVLVPGLSLWLGSTL